MKYQWFISLIIGGIIDIFIFIWMIADFENNHNILIDLTLLFSAICFIYSGKNWYKNYYTDDYK